jgi:superfamily II DNA or RNA helicase
MLNEGIDVPDVNLMVFLRVTHSRRIFIQQLGRGLRLSEGKSNVRVLDFVTDIRRIAAAHELNREAAERGERAEPGETVRYPTGRIVNFEGDEALNFFEEYLEDISELDDKDEGSHLQFPEPHR